MSEMKKYMSIVRLGHRSTVGVLKEGDNIVIQEKIDGANSSFKADKNGVLKCFSRNVELDEHNTLRGFYNWVHDSINPEDLIEDVVYYGEWNCKHKIEYPEDVTNQFYLFDLLNEDTDKFLPFSEVKNEAKRLNINLIPLFYEGKYKDFDHLMSFVGKTKLGGEEGEGIVVKNIDFIDRFGKQLFVKLVSEKFAERQKQKAPKDPSKVTQEMVFVNTFVKKPRVEKILFKLVDENIIEEDFGLEDMGLILRNMGSLVYEDIMKEEGDFLAEGYCEKKIRQSVGKKLPTIVKEIIATSQ